MAGERINKYADTCHKCGGPIAAGAGVLWWQAGPDDGGDVGGRTPAGWRVSHRTAAECEAYRTTRQTTQAAAQNDKRARLVAWLREAPAERADAVIEETDGTGSEYPRKVYKCDGVTVTWVKRGWPSLPVYYRHRADGRFDYLGSGPRQ